MNFIYEWESIIGLVEKKKKFEEEIEIEELI